MAFVDSRTGEEIEGKAYIVKSTEGEEVFAPDTLFGGSGTDSDLERRVAELEATVEALATPVPASEPSK